MNRRSILVLLALSAPLFSAWTPAQAASDPRTPINWLNTPGNADSVYRITQPGSYYLEGNLVGEAGKNGIQIEASGVTIDLMGFSLLGGAGSRTAIFSDASQVEGITIRNGFIRNWDVNGILLNNRPNTRVEDVQVAQAAVFGILVGERAVVQRCTVETIGQSGILAQNQTLIIGCTVVDAGLSGIQVGQNSRVVNCTVRQAGTGIFLFGSDSSAVDCAVFGGGDGIRSLGPATVAGCSVSNASFTGVFLATGVVRDTTVRGCGAHGIRVMNRSHVLRNSVVANGLDGIHAESSSRVEENDVRGHPNGAGIRVFGTGSFVVRNTLTANGSSMIVPHTGNFAGPLVPTNAVNGRSDPWANFVAN